MAILDGDFGYIYFTNNATSGASVNYDAKGGPFDDFIGAEITFFDNSSAGSGGVFTISGGLRIGASGSAIDFVDQSTAAHVTFICNGGAAEAAGGRIAFAGSSLSGSTVIVNGPTVPGGVAGKFTTGGSPLLQDVTVTTDGSPVAHTGGGACYLYGGTAPGCSFTLNGGAANDAGGGYVQLLGTFDSGDSIWTVNGGINGGNGGELVLTESSVVGGRVEVIGNGMLEIDQHDAPGASVGSIEGDGIVSMGALNLTVGSNLLSTTFSGTLEGDAGGSLTKIGTGTLTLSGASTYSGGTTLSAGALVVGNTTGSATGTGAVTVNGGTLGGGGTISGAVTVGTGSGSGATLQPGFGTNKKITLRVGSHLTLKSDATYNFHLKSPKAEAIVNMLTIESGAQFVLTAPNRKLAAGASATVISNTSTSPISGTFADLADGATITSGGNTYKANYEGGDGNDLTLTVQ